MRGALCYNGLQVGQQDSWWRGQVSVLTAPSISSHPSSVSTHAGDAVTFSVTATGNPSPTYQWERSEDGGSSWIPILGATDSSLTLAYFKVKQL